MISQGKIRENFSRAARHYERYADIQNSLAEELLECLIDEQNVYSNILDIGCGTGRLIVELKRHFPKSRTVGLDISWQMCKASYSKGAKALTADAGCLPFQKESFEVVVSNATYQWIQNLDRAFGEALRVLKKNGVFLFSCFISGTLEELRSCFGITRNLLPTEDALISSLKKAGFSEIEYQIKARSKYFDDLPDILRWLKCIGANQINLQKVFLTPAKLAQANNTYCAKYRNNGRVCASFEVISVKAKKR